MGIRHFESRWIDLTHSQPSTNLGVKVLLPDWQIKFIMFSNLEKKMILEYIKLFFFFIHFQFVFFQNYHFQLILKSFSEWRQESIQAAVRDLPGESVWSQSYILPVFSLNFRRMIPRDFWKASTVMKKSTLSRKVKQSPIFQKRRWCWR